MSVVYRIRRDLLMSLPEFIIGTDNNVDRIKALDDGDFVVVEVPDTIHIPKEMAHLLGEMERKST